MDLFYFLAIVVIGLLVLIPVNLKLFRKSAQSRQLEKPAEEQTSESRGGNLTEGRAPGAGEPRVEAPAAHAGTIGAAPAAAASPDLAEASHAGTDHGRPVEDRAPERAVPAAASEAPETAPARPDAPAPSPEEPEEARFAQTADESLTPPAQQPEDEPELPPRSQRHAGHTHGRKASLRGGSIRPAAQARSAEAPLPAEPPHEAAAQPDAGMLASGGSRAAESAAPSAEPRLQSASLCGPQAQRRAAASGRRRQCSRLRRRSAAQTGGSCGYGSCVYGSCVYGSCVYGSCVYGSCGRSRPHPGCGPHAVRRSSAACRRKSRCGSRRWGRWRRRSASGHGLPRSAAPRSSSRTGAGSRARAAERRKIRRPEVPRYTAGHVP
ncbi:hypothetical protein [Paenibacillus sp. 1P03SA]|uniref:hypothetical protein n=1 Tax=Paenibacillus sp. 1P03SA TaxID=3132294 RepID=UPI00399F376A